MPGQLTIDRRERPDMPIQSRLRLGEEDRGETLMNARLRAAIAASALAALSLTGLVACAPEPGETAPTTTGTPKPAPSESAQPEVPAEPEVPEKPDLTQAELDQRLRDAAWANDVVAAEQLIEWGADVNAADDTVQSAYLIATSEGRLELLRLTLKHGGDVKALDSWQGTGLIRAAERGHWDVSGALIRAGVDVNHVNNIGYQAIHEAVWLGRDDPTYLATLRVLVAGGAELDRLSVSEGLTPLQMAEERGFSGQAEVLRSLAAAAAPSDPGAALVEAARTGETTAVVAALRAGADPRSAGSDGLTAVALAEAGGHVAAAQVIRALGG